MSYYDLVQWQVPDEDNGCVMPWFTHPFLEELKQWELKDKYVGEWGAGRSTAWWAKEAELVVAVEANKEWKDNVVAELDSRNKEFIGKAAVLYCPAEEGEQDLEKREKYIKSLSRYLWGGPVPYDIIVVDGILRYECMIEGIRLLSRRGGKLIVDNWQQDGFICPACAELMAPYQGKVYRQEDHTDHHGNPWQTAYWEIPANNDKSSQ